MNDVKFFKDDAKDLIEKVNEVSTRLFDFEQNKRMLQLQTMCTKQSSTVVKFNC